LDPRHPAGGPAPKRLPRAVTAAEDGGAKGGIRTLAAHGEHSVT